MTEETYTEIMRLHHHGWGPNRIARELGLQPYSVRRMLKRGEFLDKEHQRRKDRGASDYKCSVCGETGHNRRTHGVER